MMRKLVLGSCFIFSLFNGDCWGMKRSSSDSNILSKRNSTQITSDRRSSDPITAQEKAHAIEITSMKQFRELTSDQTKELRSVTFSGMEINGEFVNKFWELFSEGVNELNFEGCHATSGYTFPYLFDSLYQVVNLKIIDCELSIQDAETILSLISPYVIRTIDFSGNRFNKRDTLFGDMIGRWITNRVCLDKPILCTP